MWYVYLEIGFCVFLCCVKEYVECVSIMFRLFVCVCVCV